MAQSEERSQSIIKSSTDYDIPLPCDIVTNENYWDYCSHTYNYDLDDKTKNLDSSQHSKKNKHSTKVDILLCNACDMLTRYFNPQLHSQSHVIPASIFQEAKGIIFLRIWKVGLIVGSMGGSGVVISRVNGYWSNPCAIGIQGLEIGLDIGIERVDHILILRDDNMLQLFEKKGQLKLGVDFSIALGPYGKGTTSGDALSNEQSKSIYSYSFAKGAYVGFSLDGGILSVNNSLNEEFYKRKINTNEILNDRMLVPQNEEYLRLVQLLNEFCLDDVIVDK